MKSAIVATFLTGSTAWLFNIKPNLPLLIYTVLGSMILDFITGVVKAKLKGVERTSEGYRRTVRKVTQYLAATLLSLGIMYVVDKLVADTGGKMVYLPMFVMIFIIYIEVTSIFENIYAVDQQSPFSKYFVRPLLAILKFGLKNNPAQQASDKITGGGASLWMLFAVLVFTATGCMTEKKAQRIGNDYDMRHPDNLAAKCTDRFPSKTQYIKGDTITTVRWYEDTATRERLQKEYDSLTDKLIADMMPPVQAQSPDCAAAVKEALIRAAVTFRPNEAPRAKETVKTVTDTLKVPDSAAIHLLQKKMADFTDSLVRKKTELATALSVSEKRKKQRNTAYWIIAGIVVLVCAGIYFKLKK